MTLPYDAFDTSIAAAVGKEWLFLLQSQYDAAKSANEKQIKLYYGIGKYISENSRAGYWGTGAIDAISDRLQKELPGLRGFSARNLRNMRMFYEEWAPLDNKDTEVDKPILADASAKMNTDTQYTG